MKQFLETICIIDGNPQHLEWHQRRVDATLHQFYPSHQHSWQLRECIRVHEQFSAGVTRCRMIYDAHQVSIHYHPYHPRQIETLAIVEIPPSFEYMYKYAERTILEELFSKRGNADDILMVDEGWIKDTSIANIAFRKNERWYTPSM